MADSTLTLPKTFIPSEEESSSDSSGGLTLPKTFVPSDSLPIPKSFIPSHTSPATYDELIRSERRAGLTGELERVRRGEVPVPEPEPDKPRFEGDWRTQAGIGTAGGIASLGQQMNKVLEVLARFAPKLPTSELMRPGGREETVEQFAGASKVAGQMAREIEELGQATGGPPLARQVSGGAISTIPSVAAAPIGLPAAVLAAGMQSFGGTMASAEEAYLKQGLDPAAARRKALMPALASGAVTAVVTRGFGATGVEAWTKVVQGGGLKASLKEIAKQSGLEAPEEFWDQVGQRFIEELSFNPSATAQQALAKTLDEATQAGVTGALVAGGLHTVRQAAAVEPGQETVEIISPETRVRAEAAVRKTADAGMPATAAALAQTMQATTTTPEEEITLEELVVPIVPQRQSSPSTPSIHEAEATVPVRQPAPVVGETAGELLPGVSSQIHEAVEVAEKTPTTASVGMAPATVPITPAPEPTKVNPAEIRGIPVMRRALFSAIGPSLNDFIRTASREDILKNYRLASELLDEINDEIKLREKLGEDPKVLFPMRYDVDGIRASLENTLLSRPLPSAEPAPSLTPAAPPATVTPEPETITVPEGGKAPEMTAERPTATLPPTRPVQPRKKPAKAERPFDIIDAIEGRGLKISLPSVRKIREDFKAFGAARGLFSRAAKDSIDSVLDALHREGLFGGITTEDEFLDAILDAAQARKSARAGQSAETREVQRQEAQREDFERAALEGRRTKSEPKAETKPVPVTELFVGDEFELAGTKVRVKEFRTDPDTGDVSYVVLEDGRRFEVQTLGPDEVIYPDKGSLTSEFEEKPAPSPTAPSVTVVPSVPPTPPKPAGELFAATETPFNLVGETARAPVPAAPPAPAPTPGTLTESELFAVEEVAKVADPVASADAAQKLYGDPAIAAETIRRHLSVLDSDPKVAKTFSPEQRDRLRGVLRLLEQRAAQSGRAATQAKADAVLDFLNKAIDATDPLGGKLLEGVLGAPVWLTQTAMNATLRVMRAVYQVTKDSVRAIRAAIAYLKRQNITGYNEAQTRAWLSSHFRPTLEADPNLRKVSKSKAWAYDYIPQTEAQREGFAQQFVHDLHGDNLQAAFEDARNISDSAYRSVIDAEILRSAADRAMNGSLADRLTLQRLIDRARQEIENVKTDTAQGLQAQKQTNRRLEPIKPFLAYLGIIRLRQDQTLAPLFPETTPDQIAAAIAAAGDSAARIIDSLLRSGDLALLQAVLEHTAGRNVQLTFEEKPATIDQIKEQFPLSNIRAFYEKRGAKALDKAWSALLAAGSGTAPVTAGHLWTAAKALNTELGRILKEAVRKHVPSIPAAGAAPTTEAESLATILGKEELRRGIIDRLDKEVRAAIAAETDPAKQQALTDLWDKASSALLTEPASQHLLRRMLHDRLGEVSDKDLLDARKGAQLRGQAVDAVVDDVLEVARRTARETAPLESAIEEAVMRQRIGEPALRTALNAAFDNIVAAARQRAEIAEIGRRARAAFNLTAAPTRQAEAVLAQLARTQTDLPDLSPKPRQAVRDAVKGVINGDIAPDEFRATLDTLNVPASVREALLAAAQREGAINRIAEFWKRRAQVDALLKKDSRITAILNRHARDAGIRWRDFFSGTSRLDQAARRQELFDRIKADPDFADLTQEERVKLEHALSTAWERTRMNVVRGDFSKLVELPNVAQDDLAKLRDSLPTLVKWFNTGVMDQQAFRNAVAEAYKLGSIDDATANQLLALSEKAQRAPEGVLRNRVYDEMKDVLLQHVTPSRLDVLRDVWFASVLSGIRTMHDILVGSAIHGATMTGRAAVDLALIQREPRLAGRLLVEFVAGMADGLVIGAEILRKGDYTLLPRYQQRIESLFSFTGDRPGGRLDTLESFKKFGSGWKKLLGQLAYVHRMMTAVDYVGANGARRAMLLYSAATRGDMASLNAGLLRADRAATAAAFARARSEVGPEATRALVIARARDILENGIAREVTESANELGEVTALNADPVGFGGELYRVIARAPFLVRGIAGLSFARAAINMAQNAADWLPGAGFINWLRSSPDSKLFGKGGLGHFAQLELTPERRRLQAGAQIGGLGLTLAAMALFLNRDDKDKRKIEITGSWFGRSAKEKQQLLSQGERPLSVRIGDTWVSYRNAPFAAALAIVGNMRDSQRFAPDKFNEQAEVERAINAWLGGAAYIKDVSALSQFSTLLGASSFNPDEIDYKQAGRWAGQAFGGFAAGYVPSALKEVDYWFNPEYYRPYAGFEYWIRTIPFARETIGEGPALDALGDPITVTRAPWSRYVTTVKPDPVWEVLAEKTAQGNFLPVPIRGAEIVSRTGQKRPMNEAEYYRYQKETGLTYRRILEQNLGALRNMNPEETKSFYDRVLARARESVRRGIQPTE